MLAGTLTAFHWYHCSVVLSWSTTHRKHPHYWCIGICNDTETTTPQAAGQKLTLASATLRLSCRSILCPKARRENVLLSSARIIRGHWHYWHILKPKFSMFYTACNQCAVVAVVDASSANQFQETEVETPTARKSPPRSRPTDCSPISYT